MFRLRRSRPTSLRGRRSSPSGYEWSIRRRRCEPGPRVLRAGRGGSANGVKLLVVTPEPIDAGVLRKTLGDEVRGAEGLVLSPATNQSKGAFWLSAPADAIAEPEQAKAETVEQLRAEEVAAEG